MAREHGGRAAFAKPHCPDPVCVAARKHHSQLEKRRRVFGTKVYVDAEPARRHVQSLLASGMSRPQIAAAASVLSGAYVDRTQIRNLVVGQPPRQGPAKWLRPETAKALLAVQLTFTPVTDSGYIPGIGSRRRIEALNVIGYHDATLVRMLLPALPALTHANFSSFRQRDQITARHALAVRDLYDRLKDTEGPGMHTPKMKFVRSCERKGYLPPVWWDEDLIDDPTYDPRNLEPVLDEMTMSRALAGEDVNEILTRAERIEVVLRLHQRGMKPPAIRTYLHGHLNGDRIREIIEQHEESEAA